ncbi:MAG: cobalamin-binding protein [Firmicutes bacterium]|nr:cobalamin-binding protein [Bacillota bacterium]
MELNKRRIRRLAERIFDKQCKIKKELENLSDDMKEKSIEDTEYHLYYLFQAINLNSKTLFNDYASWLRTLFISIGLPIEYVTINFECIKVELKFVLSKNVYKTLCEYLDSGIKVLEDKNYLEKEIEDNNLKELADHYLNALLAGDKTKASNIIMDEVNSGVDIKSIYLDVFQPTLEKIGNLWHHNKISVAKEHYCTAVTQFIISRLYGHLFDSKKTSIEKSMVSACIGEELHEVGIRMVTDFFELEGWDTYYLGANVPNKDIINSLKEYDSDLLAISTTMTYHISLVKNLIEEIRKDESLKNIKILVGGRPFKIDKDLWKKVGADGYSLDAKGAVNLAQRLVKGDVSYG